MNTLMTDVLYKDKRMMLQIEINLEDESQIKGDIPFILWFFSRLEKTVDDGITVHIQV